MALTGAHSTGDPGHVSDHNLIDAGIATNASNITAETTRALAAEALLVPLTMLVNVPVLWPGSGAPTSGVGQNTDYYLDTATYNLWGPKASGAWPGSASGTLLTSAAAVTDFLGSRVGNQTAYTTAVAPTVGVINRYDATSGNLSPVLPAAASVPAGTSITIEKIDSSVNLVTTTCAGSDHIDTTSGSTSIPLRTQNQMDTFTSDGTSVWAIVNKVLALPSLDTRYLTSPALTGTPTAPTATTGTNNTQVATTAFVVSSAAALLSSPAITGTPTAPTAAALTSNTQVATTAYADNAVAVEATNRTTADAAKWTIPPYVFRVSSYGAVGNGLVVNDGAMSSSTSTTTLTCATSTPFTSGMVGQAIRVEGAGASGAGLVTTIASYTSSSVVVLSAACTTTVSGAVVMWGTDDTTAITNAINAAVTYGQSNDQYAEVWFDSLNYCIAGALNSGVGGYAQIPLPNVSSTSPQVGLLIKGVYNNAAQEVWTQTSSIRMGSVLMSIINTTGYQSGSGGNPSVVGSLTNNGSSFSNLYLTWDGVSILTPLFGNSATNGIGGLDLRGVNQVDVPYFSCFSAGWHAKASLPLPLYNGGFGIAMPQVNNANGARFGRIAIAGMYVGMWAGEHTVGDYLTIQHAVYGLSVMGGQYHGIDIHYASIEHCKYHISADAVTSGVGQLKIGQCDFEDAASGNFTTTDHVLDASNHLFGDIGFMRVLASSGTKYGITVSGGSNLHMKDYRYPAGTITSPTVPAASTLIQVTDSASNLVFRDVMLFVSGGTGVSVTVDGTATGLASGVFTIPAGKKFQLGAYTAAPTLTAVAL